MSQRYDVVVVGLGAMGSATAYQLAKRGARVLGIDQFAPPHRMGSTHGETRITRLATGEGAYYLPLVRRSHEIWRELEAQTDEKLLYLSGGYVIEPQENASQYHGAAGFVPHTAQLAQEHGISHQVRDAAMIREHLPMLQVSDQYHAYYEPTGGVVNPEGAVRAQLQMAAQHGALIQTGERVATYNFDAQGVTITSDKGTYHADKLVLTTGAWINDFLPARHQAPFKVYRQVFYWFEVDELASFDVSNFPFIIWIGETLQEYYCLYPLIDGSTPALKMMTEQYVDTTHPDLVSRTAQPDEIEQMYQHFIRRKIKGVTSNCLQATVCLYTVTPDEHFVIDFHPNSDRVLVASPCSGHGFKHSAAIGECLAQMALTGESEIDMQPFSFARFE